MSAQVKSATERDFVMSVTNLRDSKVFPVGPHSTIAAYVPVGTEPGSTALLDALVTAEFEVLLPVVAPGPPAPLLWARYAGPESLQTGRFGLLEPSGSPRPSDAVLDAEMVLVPALAVDRGGVRLGRGAGYYDRTIGSVPRDRLVAVVYDDELVDELPAGPFDVPMGWALTPKSGFTRLGTT